MPILLTTWMSLLLLAGGGDPWPSLKHGLAVTGGGHGDAAVIVGVEDYTYLPDVQGATANTLAWYRYLTKARKVPGTKVHLIVEGDATPNKIINALEAAVKQVHPDGTLWFVFVGHGAPSQDGTDGVLVGKDAHADVEDFYPDTVARAEVLRLLEGSKGRAVAVLDACFSGQAGTGGQLLKGSQFAVPTSLGVPTAVTVLSAGRARDLAGPLPGAPRPAFSYLVLGALQGWGDADGDQRVTANEAVTYAQDVLRVLEPGRKQEPQLAGVDVGLTRTLPVGGSAPDLVKIREKLLGGYAATPSTIGAPPPPVTESTGPVIESGSARAAVADVAIFVEPADRVHLEVTPPKGKAVVSGSPYKNLSGEPGTWRVKAQAEGHEDMEWTFYAKVDDVTVDRKTLTRIKYADVAILAEPMAQVRLEIKPPSGRTQVSGAPYKDTKGTPGTWRVKASAAGYEDYEASFHAAGDDKTVHRIELKELGSLEVTGEPTGAAVEVSGPGAFKNTGYLDWKASGLKSGTYRVKVSRKGYQAQEKTVEVKPGRKTRLPLELQKIVEAFTGGTGASRGKADIEWVYSKSADVSFARSETTVAQYRACVEAGKCESKHHLDKSDSKYCNWGYSDRDNHPMNCVAWYGAEQFCEWAGGRLPTEQEWEAEAGAGGSRMYPWGGENPSCTRCIMDDKSTKGSAGSETDGCGEDHTWPVCSKRRGDSVSGLCDMAGSVWEWTSSWYDSDKKKRVLRGGSWFYDYFLYFRASYRSGYSPDVRHDNFGFRCVVSSQ